jgi:hypothetical protein
MLTYKQNFVHMTDMLMTCLYTRFLIPNSNGLLVITIKPEAKETVSAATMLNGICTILYGL